MLSSVYQRKSAIIKRKIADELILVPISGLLAKEQKIFSLNTVGEYIFDQLDGKKTLKEVLNNVLDKFSIDEKQATEDILQFVASVLKLGLVDKTN
jgi:hypothetical protein